jgi:hypothetical protein
VSGRCPKSGGRDASNNDLEEHRERLDRRVWTVETRTRFHGGNTGSNRVGDAKSNQTRLAGNSEGQAKPRAGPGQGSTARARPLGAGGTVAPPQTPRLRGVPRTRPRDSSCSPSNSA